MGKTIGYKGLNTRYRRLVNEFGSDSEIVKAAQKYMEYRISKKYLVYGVNEKGDTVLTGVSTSKETEQALGKTKWTSYDEWVPTVNNVYKVAKDLVNDMEPQKVAVGPSLNVDFNRKLSDLKQDPVAKQYLISKATYTASLLKDNGDIINNVYEAAKDSHFSRQSEAIQMRNVIQENAYLAYDLQWLSDANNLIQQWYFERATYAEDIDW